MQHPINPLNDAGLDMLCDRLTDISVALDDNNIHNMERIERILPLDLFNELRAYLGTIREAQRTICELLYGDQALLSSDDLIDDCPPHGIERPDMTREQADAHERLWGHIEPTSPDDHVEAIATMLATAAPTDDRAFLRYFAQLDRGVITAMEFEALVDHYWGERNMTGASHLDQVDWLYDHDVFNAEQYHSSLAEVWVEHIATVLAANDHPDNVTGCNICAWSNAAEFVNAHITARFPQMTGAPAVTPDGTPG